MFHHVTRERAAKAGVLVALLALTGWAAHAGGGFATPPHGEPDAPPMPITEPIADVQRAPRVEVAFVLDTTGSMSGLIEGAKSKIWSIANQLASGTPTPEVRMALVGYRDRGDEYVTRVRALTDDIDAVYADLQGFAAGGGGDTPESVNQALHEAVTRLAWSDDAGVYRVIFLVGDAPPHMDYPDDVAFDASVRLARQRGIVVNTVQCGSMSGTQEIWQQIASIGGGHYAAIRQDGGMLAMATPHDDELAVLNRALSETLVPYGDADERRELEAKRDRAGAAAPATVASRLGFLSKLGGRLNAGRADLVDAITGGTASLDDVPASELPPALQAMAPAERETFVKEKAQQRARVQAEIDALSRQRDAYVAEETARRTVSGEGDGFDAKVLASVREQAVSAGIAY
jgi:Mg-chelatase subunit ChlD